MNQFFVILQLQKLLNNNEKYLKDGIMVTLRCTLCCAGDPLKITWKQKFRRKNFLQRRKQKSCQENFSQILDFDENHHAENFRC